MKYKINPVLVAALALLIMLGCSMANFSNTPPAASTPTLTPPASQTPSQTSVPTDMPAAQPTATTTLPPLPTAAPVDELPLLPGTILYTRIFPQNGRNHVGVFSMTSDGQNQTALSSSESAAMLGQRSPDGRWLVYFDLLGAKPALTAMDLTNPQQQPRALFELLDDNLFEFSWSADSRFVVYAYAQPDGSEMDIYRLEIETGQLVDLTEDSLVWDFAPSWSPDGSWIVFVSDRTEDGKALDDIFRMSPDGQIVERLTDNGYDWEDKYPAWSPDGTRIAFFRASMMASASTPDGPAGLWVMNADGSDPHLVMASSGIWPGSKPVWSPDGRWLAFTEGLIGSTLWLVSVDGTDQRPLEAGDGEYSDPCWSPDSAALIVTYVGGDNYKLNLYQLELELMTEIPLGAAGFGCQWLP